MSGEIREIYIILSELGTDIVLQEVYDACGDIKGDKFVSKELFWKYIGYLKQKERAISAPREFHKDCIECKNTHCQFNGRNVEVLGRMVSGDE